MSAGPYSAPHRGKWPHSARWWLDRLVDACHILFLISGLTGLAFGVLLGGARLEWIEEFPSLLESLLMWAWGTTAIALLAGLAGFNYGKDPMLAWLMLWGLILMGLNINPWSTPDWLLSLYFVVYAPPVCILTGGA
jgi:hypothetical protein